MCSVALQAFNRDYQYGRQSEYSSLPTIRRYFNDDTINIHDDRYSRYDYVSAAFGTKYELKTRRLKHNAFPTTLLPLGKILAENPTGSVFLFKFSDGLYFITYDRKVFSGFQIATLCRQDRFGYDTAQEYIFIPVNLLTEIM